MSKVAEAGTGTRLMRDASVFETDGVKAVSAGPVGSPPGHGWGRVGRLAVVLIGAIVLIVLASVFYVGARALQVGQALDSARNDLANFPLALGHADLDDQLTASGRVHDDVEVVEQVTDDPIWRLYEKVPVFGARFRVARETGTVLAAFQRDGLQPLATAADDVNDLVPQGGRVSLPALKRLLPVVDQLSAAAAAASRGATQIDDSAASADQQSGVSEMRDEFGRVASVTSAMRGVGPMLDAVLGGEGTRRYLVALQASTSLSAGGGKVTAVSLLQVRAGRIEIVRTSPASSFEPLSDVQARTAAGGTVDAPRVGAGWSSLYGDPGTLSMGDAASSPDFPTTAQLIRAQWRARYGGRIDGVVLLNAVAFDSMLQATGALRTSGGVDLAHGGALTALEGGDASSDQGGATRAQISTQALASLIDAVRQGRGNPANYLTVLAPLADSRQVAVWSAHVKEERSALRWPVGGQLPDDNSEHTVLGAYVDSTSRSVSNEAVLARVEAVVDRCDARPRYTVRAVLPGTAALSAARHQRNEIGLQFYGPAAGKLISLHVGRKLVASGGGPTGSHSSHGVEAVVRSRPVAGATVPLQSKPTVVTAVFSGDSEDAEQLEVDVTPTSVSSRSVVASATCS